MNKQIMVMLGLDKKIADIERGKCPFCHNKIDESAFRDAISAREFEISGLCQTCQDTTFKDEGE